MRLNSPQIFGLGGSGWWWQRQFVLGRASPVDRHLRRQRRQPRVSSEEQTSHQELILLYLFETLAALVTPRNPYRSGRVIMVDLLVLTSPCTNLSAAFDIAISICFFTKRAILLRSPTVLSFSLLLVFPGDTCMQLHQTCKTILKWKICGKLYMSSQNLTLLGQLYHGNFKFWLSGKA